MQMQKKTSYNHITSSLMRSSKVPASEEERDITKKQNFEHQRVLQRKSPAGCTAFLHGARRAGWLRKGSGPREGNRENAKRSTHSSEEGPSTARSSTAQSRGSAELRHEEGHQDKSIPNRCRCKKKKKHNTITLPEA